MLALDVRPVLTAHPTESTRRTLLGLQARVADMLLAREGAPAADRRAIEEQLDAEVELLWLTAEVRAGSSHGDRRGEHGALVPRDAPARRERAGARRARARVRGGVRRDVRSRCSSSVPLTIGNWVGGDRDGNPFVTPEVTIATARRAQLRDPRPVRRRARGSGRAPVGLGAARAAERRAARVASSATRSSCLTCRRRTARATRTSRCGSSSRSCAARVEATRRLTAARDAGQPVDEPAAYADAAELEHDLLLVRENLVERRRDAGVPHDDRSAARNACARTDSTAS